MTTHTILLLVEDEALILQALEDALVDAGYSVVTAVSGSEAVTALNDRSNKFAGLITDIRIGEHTNGWEVARHARGLMPNIPVIYMSGDSAADWPFEGVPDSAILQKPFASAQLISTISHLLNDRAKMTAATTPFLSADCVTSGNIALHIRAAENTDQVAVVALFKAVDDEDLRFRFGDTVKEVGPSLVAPLLQADRSIGVTFLASTGDGIVIAASTLADIRGSDTAEVALSVHASWKGRGVAWALLEHTLAYATAHGLREVTSFECGEDRLAINLEREMGFVARLISASPVELSLTKNVSAE